MRATALSGPIALVVGLILSNSLPLFGVPATRPNVLVILTDDQRWDAMSCAGHPLLKTPNIDRLAAEGARFANMFVTTSLCSPSRASILSGVFAHRHGVLNNFTEYPDSLPSYPKRLREAGYETAYFGKWHMGETNGMPRADFDFWMSHKGQGNYFGNEWNINGRTQYMTGYYTTVVTEHAVEWLKRKHEKPFVLILGEKAPHGGPIEPEPKYERAFDADQIVKPANYDAWQEGKPAWLAESFPTWHGAGGPLYNYRDYDKFVRAYLGTLLSVDDSVGRLYATLREIGQLDNTLIVYTSDNGFALGEHGRVDKRTMYEESIRVPLLVRYPPLVPKGAVISEMALSLDLAPSILDICGAKALKNIDGQSWKPLLAGKTKGWRKSFIYFYNYEKEFPYTPNVRGIRTADWKYIHYPHGDGGPDRYTAELYNLAADPLERHNLISDPSLAGKAAELKKELSRLMRKHKAAPDPMPLDGGIINVLPKF
ncbi:MAG TPA: sulfatase [Candidatus Paceibacterota bacterium]|nr:sulfatase [Verrucomicrobiota bacterium]HSA09577.1 sulfatase [Candidatus Paceibacterota bacterium]